MIINDKYSFVLDQLNTEKQNINSQECQIKNMIKTNEILTQEKKEME